MFVVTENWRSAYPDALIGILALDDVANPQGHELLDQKKAELEDSLREKYGRYDRATLKRLPTLKAYNNYYKRFKKSYHVQLQMESVVFKGKEIPRIAALVEVMFMAELKNLLLTAGHDLAKLELPISIHVADGSESYIRMNGQEQTLKKGDMYIADGIGIMSSIIYGPDQRTSITAETKQALFTVYAPPGISKAIVRRHLDDIRDYALLVSPTAKIGAFKIVEANEAAGE